ncbi:transaldolase [Pseudozyma hubeiensis SY62]|uniref:Transaldolase n=1 Tax=Pseudozyma hubeiensis (strain SY62) TaxID=1305764 RepID=R9P5J2_PSEHS|nr:transaldolase [Pseudozyma hubeiensis SY62]GAC96594.1 transaldolase [Pseudozyma hubeiensis SY62]
MTLEQPVETTHLSDSLLAELAKHTTVDIDNNVASIAVQHNLAHRRLLELVDTTNKGSSEIQEQVVDEFHSLFQDMTSNQIIVSLTYSELLASEAPKAKKLLGSCTVAARQIEAGTWKAEKLDSVMMRRLSVNGLAGTESLEEKHQQLASDILTVYFGLDMLPHLLSNGNVHAQTATSQSYNAQATVRHARRFVALYQLLSGGSVDSSRVCIKIPSTIPGLQAMRFLSSGGQLNGFDLGNPLEEGKIQVLATTVFAVEQGLAAAQSAGAIYVAPYINALAAHFFGAENPSDLEKQKALSAGARSIREVIYPLQRCLKTLRRENEDIQTQVMAASFLDFKEAVQLCGLDHVTLGAGIVQALSSTEPTEAFVKAMQQAREEMSEAGEDELERYGGRLASEEARDQQGCGGWLKQGSKSYTRLETVLTQDERCSYMLADALARFTNAEIDLRNLFAV